MQNLYVKDDYGAVEKLCNNNLERYGTFIDCLLITYVYCIPESEAFYETHPGVLMQQSIDNIYDKIHQKILTLQ